MASNEYLDEEYFQIQDFLSVLSDTLPKIDLNKLPDVDAFITALIEQNKAYGKKIISLYETLDSVYKTTNPLEASPGMGSPDFNSKLHQKILDYEDLIKKLTSENEDFSAQIKQLSQQIESLHPKNQGNIANTSGKKSVTISTLSSSPFPKETGNGNREISSELENMFLNAEYKKGVELLTQIDYKKPLGMSVDKFNNWLTIANRLKDSSFNEILNKLKILITFADKEEEGESIGLNDSLDQPNLTVLERIYMFVDEKIPKVILSNEYKLETQKMKDKVRKSGALEDELRASKSKSESGGEDYQLTNEQLRMKVHYLNAKVEQFERVQNEKGKQTDYSKDKSRKLETFGDQDEYSRKNEELYQELQQEIDNRLKLEGQARELIEAYEDLKDKYEGLLKDVAEYDVKCQELTEQLKDNGDFIERLMQENSSLKEQFEFSEKLEDLEKMKELIQEKDSKIKYLSEELNIIKEYQKSPQKSFISESRKTRYEASSSPKDFRDQFALEAALQNQAVIINNINQTLNYLRVPLTETLKPLNLDLPPRRTVAEFKDELTNPRNEAQRLLYDNNEILREVQNEVSFIKGVTTSLCEVISSDYISLTDKYSSLTKKIAQSEERLYENLSSSIQIVSQMTSLFSEINSSSQISNQMPQIHNLLQSLHTNITNTIKEYPDLSNDIGVYQSPIKELQGRSSNLSHSFKDMLVKDQSELKTKLKSTLQNLEVNQTNEVYSKLYQEIEKNQELQEQIKAKDLVIKRLNLIFSEGIERSIRSIEQLVKLADSDEAQGLLEFVLDEVGTIKKKLKEIVDINKGPGFRLEESIQRIHDEYESQKNILQKTLLDLEETNERKIRQFIREIEGERDAHERTREKLQNTLHDMTIKEKSYKMSEEFRIEIQILNEKLKEKEIMLESRDKEYESLRREQRTLERERGNILDQVEQLKSEMSLVGHERGKLREDLLKSGGEKEEIRRSLEEIIREVEVLRKATSQKNNEIEELRKELRVKSDENEGLRRELGRFKNELEGLERVLEELKNENRNLVQKLNDATERRQKEIEPLRRNIALLERENEELKEYRGSTEAILKKTNEQVDHLKLSYFTDITSLKEENKALTTQKRQWNNDIEKKSQEIAKLNQMLDSLQDFSNKQIENIKEKDDKIALLANQRRETDQYIKDLERRIEDLTEKNRSFNDSMSQNSQSVQMLKEELHHLMDKQAGLQRDLLVTRQKNEELIKQNQDLIETRDEFASSKITLEDKVKKMNEIVQITKNELKNCRDLLEEKNTEIAHKDHELMILKEIPSRERDNFSHSDLISRLKRELEARSNEVLELKKDYRKSLEKNEKLNIEIDTMRAATRFGDQHGREIERMNELTRTMSVEVETLRKSIRQRDDQFNIEKENYERELHMTRKKINDLQGALDKQSKGGSKSFSDSMKSSGNLSTGGSSYYTSVIESKDLEIKRLTQIVKNLTENLRDTQESKYKLKK